MNKKSNLEKLGKETANGDIAGTLSYQTKVKGFSGLVIMEAALLLQLYCSLADPKFLVSNLNKKKAWQILSSG